MTSDRGKSGDELRAELEAERRRRVELEKRVADQDAELAALRPWRELFLSGPVVLFHWGREDRWPIEYVSENVRDLCGYTASELVDQKFEYADLVYHEDVHRLLEEGRRHNEPSFIHEPYRLIHKDGGTLWVLEVVTRVWDGQGEKIGSFGYVFEITERVQAGNELKRIKEVLDESQRLSLTGGWEIDIRSRRTFWSDNHFRIYGYEPGEFSHHYLFFFRHIVHPDDANSLRDAFRRALQDQVRVELEYRARLKNGEEHHFQGITVPDVDENGTVRRLIGVNRDVTESKKYSEALILAREQADAASKSKSEFLANMSHEIRTPLNGIMGMLQLMNVSDLDEHQAEYVMHAMRSCKHLTRLLGDILDLSRVEADKLQIREEPFSLFEIFDSMRHLFLRAARREGVELVLSCDEEIPVTLVGDDQRLRQVLFNILGNAVKFTSVGEVRAEAWLMPVRSEDKRRVLFVISDTGAGIPEYMLEHVFETFSQGENAYTRQFQGAGLGLSIARRLLSLLGGNMSVISEQGKGTVFHISIPFGCTGVEEATVQRSVSATPSGGNGELRRVLVVEDDKVSRLTLVRFLEMAGLQVLSVDNGEDALRVFEESDVDLVFMDIQLPRMDGLEVCRHIRTDSRFRDKAELPIVALTAYAMAEERDRFLDAGMDDYLSKPVEMEALNELLARFGGAVRER